MRSVQINISVGVRGLSAHQFLRMGEVVETTASGSLLGAVLGLRVGRRLPLHVVWSIAAAVLQRLGVIDHVARANLASPHPEWRAKTITWEGHEFLDASRDDTRGGALTLEALKLVLSDLIRRALQG